MAGSAVTYYIKLKRENAKFSFKQFSFEAAFALACLPPLIGLADVLDLPREATGVVCWVGGSMGMRIVPMLQAWLARVLGVSIHDVKELERGPDRARRRDRNDRNDGGDDGTS